MSKASEKKLTELHGKLAEVLTEGLQYRNEDGKPDASILSVARQFLKDNHIEAGALKADTPLAGLAGLPVFDEGGNVVPISAAGG